MHACAALQISVYIPTAQEGYRSSELVCASAAVLQLLSGFQPDALQSWIDKHKALDAVQRAYSVIVQQRMMQQKTAQAQLARMQQERALRAQQQQQQQQLQAATAGAAVASVAPAGSTNSSKPVDAAGNVPL